MSGDLVIVTQGDVMSTVGSTNTTRILTVEMCIRDRFTTTFSSIILPIGIHSLPLPVMRVTWRAAAAVSYTHLDVYKRQLVILRILRIPPLVKFAGGKRN